MLFLIVLYYKYWPTPRMIYVSCDNFPLKYVSCWNMYPVHNPLYIFAELFLKACWRNWIKQKQKSAIWGCCWTPWSMKRRGTLSGQCHNYSPYFLGSSCGPCSRLRVFTYLISPHNNLWVHYYCFHLQMNKMMHREMTWLVQILLGEARI